MKKQTSVAEKQYQWLNKLFKSNEKEEPVTIKKEKSAITYESKLMYYSKYSFSDFSNIKKCYVLSFASKFVSFYHQLNEFKNPVLQTEKTKIK